MRPGRGIGKLSVYEGGLGNKQELNWLKNKAAKRCPNTIVKRDVSHEINTEIYRLGREIDSHAAFTMRGGNYGFGMLPAKLNEDGTYSLSWGRIFEPADPCWW